MFEHTQNQLLKTTAAVTLAVSALALSQPAQAYDYNYYDYDYNQDGMLDESEYVDYSYDTIDYDRDGRINTTEWKYYTNVWYKPYKMDTQPRSFSYYDTDNDGFIESVEYQSAYDSNLYRQWDVDNDGFVETVEYNAVVKDWDTYDYNDVY